MSNPSVPLRLVTEHTVIEGGPPQPDPFAAITDPDHIAILHTLEADGSLEGANAAHAYGSLVLMATNPNVLSELERARFPHLISALVTREPHAYVMRALSETGLKETFRRDWQKLFCQLDEKLDEAEQPVSIDFAS